MTENRHFAAGLRALAGLIALAGLLGLSACGGGAGAPNNVFDTPGALTLAPNALNVYSGNPATITVQGGQPPYTVFSSDASALPVQTNVVGSTISLMPNVVAADTAVTLTTRDARGSSSTGTVTIKPAPLINTLKLKADSYTTAGCPNAGGSSSATDDSSSTFICSGQTGSVAVRLANTVGGGIAGRLVRFEIVQGPFQIFTELPGQTPSFALTYTVPTDQDGNAIARIRANPGASQQIVIVQATDVNTGMYVRGVFVIIPVVNAAAASLVVVPNSVTITGVSTASCSSNVSSTYYIFGGQPPYTVVSSFPQATLLSPTVVQTSGAGFTVTTVGSCVDPATLAITDAAGHVVTVTFTNKPGTSAPVITPTTSNNPITVAPSPIPTLTCSGIFSSTSIAVGGGGTTTSTGTDETVTPATSFFLSTLRGDILSIIPSSAVAPTEAITLMRLPGSTVDGALPPGATVGVLLSIFDGNQTRKVNVSVTNTCP